MILEGQKRNEFNNVIEKLVSTLQSSTTTYSVRILTKKKVYHYPYYKGETIKKIAQNCDDFDNMIPMTISTLALIHLYTEIMLGRNYSELFVPKLNKTVEVLDIVFGEDIIIKTDFINDIEEDAVNLEEELNKALSKQAKDKEDVDNYITSRNVNMFLSTLFTKTKDIKKQKEIKIPCFINKKYILERKENIEWMVGFKVNLKFDSYWCIITKKTFMERLFKKEL